MSDLLAFIRKHIASDIGKKTVVDIGRYCRLLADSRPDLQPHELQSQIILIVADYHGSASWGKGRQDGDGDRFVLTPGPESETEVVRYIYRLLIHEKRTELEIASELNQRGITTDLGRPWTRGTVYQV